jgi:hypothetical protein
MTSDSHEKPLLAGQPVILAQDWVRGFGVKENVNVGQDSLYGLYILTYFIVNLLAISLLYESNDKFQCLLLRTTSSRDRLFFLVACNISRKIF